MVYPHVIQKKLYCHGTLIGSDGLPPCPGLIFKLFLLCPDCLASLARDMNGVLPASNFQIYRLNIHFYVANASLHFVQMAKLMEGSLVVVQFKYCSPFLIKDI